VTEDRSRGPHGGDEVVFGGGKVIRESMGQSRVTRAEGALDTRDHRAVVLDHWGVIKADVGIRDGRIVALGKAGNPDTMDGVRPAAGDRSVHRGDRRQRPHPDRRRHRLPRAPDRAPAGRRSPCSGVTTWIAGGTGPAEGTKATTITPGPWYLARMFEAMDGLPINVALLGQGKHRVRGVDDRADPRRGLGFQAARGLGYDPAVIDAKPSSGRPYWAPGRHPHRHPDEAGFVEDTLAAIAGRGIHAYHTEGAGGGHAPDIITVAGALNVLPSSTNPTRPHTVNTLAEHLDMLMVCHHLNPSVPEDLAFAESRIRPLRSRRRTCCTTWARSR